MVFMPQIHQRNAKEVLYILVLKGTCSIVLLYFYIWLCSDLFVFSVPTLPYTLYAAALPCPCWFVLLHARFLSHLPILTEDLFCWSLFLILRMLMCVCVLLGSFCFGYWHHVSDVSLCPSLRMKRDGPSFLSLDCSCRNWNFSRLPAREVLKTDGTRQ